MLRFKDSLIPVSGSVEWYRNFNTIGFYKLSIIIVKVSRILSPYVFFYILWRSRFEIVDSLINLLIYNFKID